MKSRLSQYCQAFLDSFSSLGDSAWWVDVSEAIGDYEDMSVFVKRRGALLFVPLIWLWVFVSQGSDKLHEHAERASAAMQRNDFVEAEKEYRAILAIAPQLAEMRSNLGLALHMQDRFEQAEKEFREALRANPKLFAPNYFLGIQLFKTNRYKEARTCLEAAVALNPSMKETRYRLGATYVGLKEYDEAIRQYREILKQHPNEVDALYSIGKVYNELMQRTAEELLNSSSGVYYGLMLIEASEGGEAWQSLVDGEIPKIIEAHPSVPVLRYELGRLLLQNGKMEAAKHLFQEELAVDLRSFRARYGLAQIGLASGQYGDFSRELEQAVRIRPEVFCPLPPLVLEIPATDLAKAIQRCDSSLAQQFLAAQLGQTNLFCEKLAPYKQQLAASDKDPKKSPEALFGEKRYEAVISRLENQSKMKSTIPSRRLLLAQAYFETGRLETAAEIAEALSLRHEVEEAAHYLQSRCYQMLAVQSLAELDRIAPDSSRAHQLRGEAHFIRKNMREAIAAFKMALDREPEDPELLYELGRAHYYLGEFSQAFEALQKSLKLDPYNAEANYIIGEGMVHTQEAGRAVPFLQRALVLDPSILKAHGELGKAFLQMNQWKKAVAELELASSADPGGELHYQLFRAYTKLDQKERAQGALAQSNKLRQEKIERERTRLASREQP
jgi:tetratricopeptide (TPR) repeat protein